MKAPHDDIDDLPDPFLKLQLDVHDQRTRADRVDPPDLPEFYVRASWHGCFPASAFGP